MTHTIEWNKVTWYSKLAAVIVFLATFFIAFNLGVLWEKTAFETALTASTPLPDTTSTSSAGAHCGGFIRNTSTCSTGYHCQLGPIADKGGTCVKD